MLGPRKGRAERGRQSGSGVGFSTGQDSATFREKGTEVPSLSWDKGTTGQAKNHVKVRDGPGQPKGFCPVTFAPRACVRNLDLRVQSVL